MSQLIPTNLITGFLGAGKTTAIRQLLQQYPDERWGVLVNEFGEVGIDGALLAGSGGAIREVPGGCMCCVAGLPTRVALNRLIKEARPGRLLIEPTGLGHPAQILDMLSTEDYQDVLDLRATLTLVDPRVLEDSRYRTHENFLSQVATADRLVGTKADLCTPAQLDAFRHWASEQQPPADVSIIQQGKLELAWLDQPRRSSTTGNPQQTPLLLQSLTPQFATTQLTPDQHMVKKENSSAGFYSCGWIFNADYRFAFDRLFQLLNNLDVLRAKAVMVTEKGTFGFNLAQSSLSVNELPAADTSRIEFIGPDPINWDLLQSWLLKACDHTSTL